MSYEIILSESTRLDLRNIYEYITYELQVPEIGKSMVNRILTEIEKLTAMPERHRIYAEEPMCSNEIRLLPVAKYLIC